MRALIIVSLLIVGCKEQAAMDAEAAPDGRTQLQSHGCSISKRKGVMSITCADGSSASSAPAAVHIKAGNGAEYSNLLVIGFYDAMPMVMNTESGNVLSYDGAGNISTISATLFDGINCTGNAYALQSSSGVVKNRVFGNNQAWPGGAQGLRVIGHSAISVSFQSQFTGGNCLATSVSYSNVMKLAPTTLDPTDPLTLPQPFELVNE